MKKTINGEYLDDKKEKETKEEIIRIFTESIMQDKKIEFSRKRELRDRRVCGEFVGRDLRCTVYELRVIEEEV